MSPSDKQVVCSGFHDKALDAEESQWFEQELSEDANAQAYMETLRGMSAEIQAISSVCMPQPSVGALATFLQEKKALQPIGWQDRLRDITEPMCHPTVSAGVLLVAGFAFFLFWLALDYGNRPVNRHLCQIEQVSCPDPQISASVFFTRSATVIWLSGAAASEEAQDKKEPLQKAQPKRKVR